MLRQFNFSENRTGCGDAALLLRKGSFAQRVCFRCVLPCREINRSNFGRRAPVQRRLARNATLKKPRAAYRTFFSTSCISFREREQFAYAKRLGSCNEIQKVFLDYFKP
jgi:hypothetical protein